MKFPLALALAVAMTPGAAVAQTPAASPAATPAATPAPKLVPASQLHIDAAYVNKYGSGKRALILIPGLASGAYVWDRVLPGLVPKYTVYTLTFAGFDGEPPIAGPYLDTYVKSIEDLIASQKLVKPLLIGHSLGGYLALRIAEVAPGSIGGALIVDALPIFPPPMQGTAADQREAAAANFRDAMLKADATTFANQATFAMAQLVTAPQDVALIAARSLQSDRATYAGTLYEMSTHDLRPNLSKVSVPLTVIVPAPETGQAPYRVEFYKSLYAGTPNITFVPIAPSKHFVMYDQPGAFAAALDDYLEKNERP